MLLRFFIFEAILKIGNLHADDFGINQSGLGFILNDLDKIFVEEDYLFDHGKVEFIKLQFHHLGRILSRFSSFVRVVSDTDSTVTYQFKN